jgi:hypothetical protein
VSIGSNSIEVNSNYTLNTTPTVKVVHDNTYGFTNAINDAVVSEVNSLIIPGGTYLLQSIEYSNRVYIKG